MNSGELIKTGAEARSSYRISGSEVKSTRDGRGWETRGVAGIMRTRTKTKTRWDGALRTRLHATMTGYGCRADMRGGGLLAWMQTAAGKAQKFPAKLSGVLPRRFLTSGAAKR